MIQRDMELRSVMGSGTECGGKLAIKHIGLLETIEALRAELSAARVSGKNQDIHFPVGSVQLEFHVGVTKDIDAKAGVKFWVIELGAEGKYSHESIQKVVITLGPPVNNQGRPVQVGREYDEKP
jgi:hypothetical protein